jgi:predicted nucleotidyltransferase
MVDIKEITPEIIELLKPLRPDRIILFGSYANGNPTEDSDIDIFLLKDDLRVEDSRRLELDASIRIYDLVKKYKIGFDILSAPTEYIKKREDYFYRVDILRNGKVLYEHNCS